MGKTREVVAPTGVEVSEEEVVTCPVADSRVPPVPNAVVENTLLHSATNNRRFSFSGLGQFRCSPSKVENKLFKNCSFTFQEVFDLNIHNCVFHAKCIFHAKTSAYFMPIREHISCFY